tara:strand:+ start:58 stop:702 length:645 start_codon:yes stop_codon:yes gene_type:complete
MDQEIEIINTNTRNEKIKNFFIKNKNKLIIFIIIIFLSLASFFYFEDYKSKKKEDLSTKYNQLIITNDDVNKANLQIELKKIIEAKDKTYSPLAFYFLLDNDLITSREEINKYFDILINEIGLDKENKNLTTYKKALYNSNFVDENKLLSILNPVIQSKSIWKPHALFLMAEFYYAKNQKQKSKEFFNKLINIEDANSKVKLEAQKRLRSDFSE